MFAVLADITKHYYPNKTNISKKIVHNSFSEDFILSVLALLHSHIEFLDLASKIYFCLGRIIFLTKQL